VHYSLTWKEATSVVLTSTVLYVALLGLIRVAGRRIVAAISAYDVAAGIALGAIMGRAILGYTPSLTAGALGFGALLGLHCGTRQLMGNPRLDRLLGTAPVLVMRDGRVLASALRGTKLSEDDLRTALRRAGIGSYSDVGAAVVERTGTISVIRVGSQTMDVLVGVEDGDGTGALP